MYKSTSNFETETVSEIFFLIGIQTFSLAKVKIVHREECILNFFY